MAYAAKSDRYTTTLLIFLFIFSFSQHSSLLHFNSIRTFLVSTTKYRTYSRTLPAPSYSDFEACRQPRCHQPTTCTAATTSAPDQSAATITTTSNHNTTTTDTDNNLHTIPPHEQHPMTSRSRRAASRPTPYTQAGTPRYVHPTASYSQPPSFFFNKKKISSPHPTPHNNNNNNKCTGD